MGTRSYPKPRSCALIISFKTAAGFSITLLGERTKNKNGHFYSPPIPPHVAPISLQCQIIETTAPANNQAGAAALRADQPTGTKRGKREKKRKAISRHLVGAKHRAVFKNLVSTDKTKQNNKVAGPVATNNARPSTPLPNPFFHIESTEHALHTR